MNDDIFRQDSTFVARIHPSLNFEERRGGTQADILILHYTGMASAEAAIRWLAEPASKVSCHYVIDEFGTVTQMVPERHRAWHAGASCWRGCDDINSRSIGIEIQNPGHSGGYIDFPPAQMTSVIALAGDIVARHGIRPHAVLAHSDIAPRRKEDPGERFDWRALWEAGIGHWVSPAPVTGGEMLSRGARGSAVLRLQRQLRAYGYWIEPSAEFDEHTEIVVTAFQRHFRPGCVDGRADASTVATLDALLASLP